MGPASGSLASTSTDNVTHTGATFTRLDVEALAEGILALEGTPAPAPVTGPVDTVPAGVLTASAANSQTVVINPGNVIQGLDFGNFFPGTVSGTVYLDQNGDGTLDNAEGGLAGWAVKLHANAGSAADQTFTTDSTGAFSFGNLAAG